MSTLSLEDIQNKLHRVVEIYAPNPLDANRGGLGSGFAVTDDLVLTAKHVVQDAKQVRVRGLGEEWPTYRSAEVVWLSVEWDAALVRLTDTPWFSASDRGELHWVHLSGQAPIPWVAYGFPRATQFPSGQGRELEGISGNIIPGAGFKRGILPLNVTSARPLPTTEDSSPGQGLSGAAILTEQGRKLIGLIVHDPPSFETSRLQGIPVEHLVHDPEFAQLVGVQTTEPVGIQSKQEIQALALLQNPAKPRLSPSHLDSHNHGEVTPAHPLTSLLQVFEFDVALYKQSPFRRFFLESHSISRYRCQAQYFTEDLGNGVVLEMVLIPNGSFLMGSPDNEAERSGDEGPQHEVKVASFFIGKYPVTQGQWQTIAALPKVFNELDPDPSRCKGIGQPVEQVSWYDVNEFCARLSRKTGREYRLPSEAEWEYACRAGTTTPFYFGEGISPRLANYDSRFIYGFGMERKPFGRTTQVGSFQTANAFGLYDMLGNVWEWCADPWHDSYETPGYKSAPSNGAAWEEGSDSIYRLLRGGSWRDPPKYC